MSRAPSNTTEGLLLHQRVGLSDPLTARLGRKRTQWLNEVLASEGRGYDPRSLVWKHIAQKRLQYALAIGYSTFDTPECPEPVRQAIIQMVALDQEFQLLLWKEAKQGGWLDEKDSQRRTRVSETRRKTARDIGYVHRLPDEDVALRIRRLKEEKR